MGHGRAWCATETDSTGNYISGKWGNCGPACDEENTNSSQRKVEEISSVPNGCDMISGKVCYDKCPHGSEPLPITGGFRPFCQTKCSESNHHIDCGYGCANRNLHCAKAVVDQIGTVVKAVSKVVSIATGVPNAAAIFDALVSLADFIVSTLPKLIDFARKAWDKLSTKFEAGEQQVGIILTIMELAKEAGSSFMDKFLKMHETIKQIPRMFKELLDAEWSWLDLDKASSILEQFGVSEILLGFKLVETFKRPKCEVADATPVFTITDAGDERLKGKWMRQGMHRDRPRYTLIGDSNEPRPTIHWSKNEYWRAFVDNSWHWWRETLYTSDKNETTVPLDGWVRVEGADPAPTLQMEL
jgi:hypothetical protein